MSTLQKAGLAAVLAAGDRVSFDCDVDASGRLRITQAQLWINCPISKLKLADFDDFELPFFDFGPFEFDFGPEFDPSRFDEGFFALPEADSTPISTILRLEIDRQFVVYERVLTMISARRQSEASGRPPVGA